MKKQLLLLSAALLSISAWSQATVTLPYEANLNNADEAAQWTIVDANNDGKTWTYGSGEFAYTSFNSANDYLFTPAFATVAGSHALTYTVKGYNGRYSDAYEVILANSTDVANATVLQVIETTAQNGVGAAMYKEKTVDFEVPARGTYYIGYHDVTTDAWGLYIGSTKIVSNVATGLRNIEAPRAAFNRSSQAIEVPGKARVTVATLGGIIVAGSTVEQALSVAHLPNGAYVALVKRADGGVDRIKFIK
ncbi:MAG: choice-of-anchor J domain-containing protein [Muribaculaceae bacterium]|nr:choice-of-anchor J domain-containing protein [Muribaculaceae bacterium]